MYYDLYSLVYPTKIFPRVAYFNFFLGSRLEIGIKTLLVK